MDAGCDRKRFSRLTRSVRLAAVIRDEITDLLTAWSDGDEAAREALWPLVYDELRRLAGEFMNGERDSHTLQPTALVHEAFLRLTDQDQMRYTDRRHFFAMASRMMRRVLVDHARAKGRTKRDWGERVPVEIAIDRTRPSEVNLGDLDEALTRFEAFDEEKARIVELKFFGGLTNDEIAAVRGCSERTIRRHWQVAKLWLYNELSRTHAM